MSMNVLKKVFEYGKHTVTLETGGIARQATGAVKVTMGETVVLVTVVAQKEADPGKDFFPLTVNYIEKSYAAGKIPGGFLRREGRPGDHESLTSRLIDRPLRPLFPKGFVNEVQVVATVMSYDPEVSPDIVALIGASAAVSLSGVPFAGPVAAARVGYDKEGNYLLNPSEEVVDETYLDLVVAGTCDAVLMVESDAKQLPEDVMMGAVLYGHEQMQVVVQAINELVEASGRESWSFEPKKHEDKHLGLVKKQCGKALEQAFAEKDKKKRYELKSAYQSEAKEALLDQFVSDDVDEGSAKKKISELVDHLEYVHVRESILSGKPRIDGRDTKTVRPILIDTGVLPRTHGSAIFTRGETQAIVVSTLGSERDSKLAEYLNKIVKEKFMLHYNFPPYSVGETGMIGSPKRREIGHGNLAKRAIKHVLPEGDDFPYVMRVVSEITESNGSSSMATVCGSSLSLMNAGVPIKAPVAGIAMGLIKEGDRYAVLTDILGDEDHLGDMDFKVAGTKEGVTALQMDIKITGITKEIMEVALDQAKEARMHILGLMNDAVKSVNAELSPYAPRFERFNVNPEKIRDIIGKGGAVIKSMSEDTGASIDLTDDGVVSIFAPTNEALTAVLARIEDIIAEAELGEVYDGEVVRIADFGAFVSILPNKDGLLHISQISHERVNKVTDVLNVGDKIKVKVTEIDRMGRVKLSMKELAPKPEGKADAAGDKPEKSSDKKEEKKSDGKSKGKSVKEDKKENKNDDKPESKKESKNEDVLDTAGDAQDEEVELSFEKAGSSEDSDSGSDEDYSKDSSSEKKSSSKTGAGKGRSSGKKTTKK